MLWTLTPKQTPSLTAARPQTRATARALEHFVAAKQRRHGAWRLLTPMKVKLPFLKTSLQQEQQQPQQEQQQQHHTDDVAFFHRYERTTVTNQWHSGKTTAQQAHTVAWGARKTPANSATVNCRRKTQALQAQADHGITEALAPIVSYKRMQQRKCDYRTSLQLHGARTQRQQLWPQLAADSDIFD